MSSGPFSNRPFWATFAPPVTKWKEAGHWCLEHKSELAQQEAHGDGVQIIAGQSWMKPFEDRVE